MDRLSDYTLQQLYAGFRGPGKTLNMREAWRRWLEKQDAYDLLHIHEAQLKFYSEEWRGRLQEMAMRSPQSLQEIRAFYEMLEREVVRVEGHRSDGMSSPVDWKKEQEFKQKELLQQQYGSGGPNRHERRKLQVRMKRKVKQIIRKQDIANAKRRAKQAAANSDHHDGAARVGEDELGRSFL